MDGIHDLGGMDGFGPIPITGGDEDLKNLEDWEKRVWGFSKCAAIDDITIDWFRHAIECMVPADYLNYPYFNKWCTAYFLFLLDNGKLTLEDVRRGGDDNPSGDAKVMTVADVLTTDRSADYSFELPATSEEKYAVGDAVLTKTHMHDGHTRLPRYARGKRGTILRRHGGHVLPDEGALGRHVGEHLYTVSFSATELWGDGANPKDTVSLDLWESYLDPA